MKRYAPFIFGVASGLGITWFIWQRRKDTDDLKIWKQVVVKRHGAERVQQIISAIRQQRAALVAATPMPENQALRRHLRENILPGLALYRVLLQEHDGDQQAALAEVDEAFRAHTLAKNRVLLAPLKILPGPFRLFKLAFARVMEKFPAEGWDFAYVENNDNTIAFNATRCFYLDSLTALGAPELTASFCKCDDVMAECFPPSIRFVRPHTLGRGDTLCDFQYCRVQKDGNR